MIDKATNCDLVAGLKAHREETNKQVGRLQKVFEKLGKEASGADPSHQKDYGGSQAVGGAVFWGVVSDVAYHATLKKADPKPEITVSTDEVIMKFRQRHDHCTAKDCRP
jgi:ferritin-like metal-binding protein YciE